MRDGSHDFLKRASSLSTVLKHRGEPYHVRVGEWRVCCIRLHDMPDLVDLAVTTPPSSYAGQCAGQLTSGGMKQMLQ
jgi:hypothetical protein